jgi:hypothetical protein
MNALARLIELRASPELQRVMAIEKLHHLLAKRLPAVLNKTDYTIGFKCDAPRVLRVLDLLGFRTESDARTSKVLSNKEFRIRIVIPREEWCPILQYLN